MVTIHKEALVKSCIKFYKISAMNYVAVSKTLGVSPFIFIAGLAVDNVLCAMYFITLFTLASSAHPYRLRLLALPAVVGKLIVSNIFV
jgi:uncharacterized membrane protein